MPRATAVPCGRRNGGPRPWTSRRGPSCRARDRCPSRCPQLVTGAATAGHREGHQGPVTVIGRDVYGDGDGDGDGIGIGIGIGFLDLAATPKQVHVLFCETQPPADPTGAGLRHGVDVVRSPGQADDCQAAAPGSNPGTAVAEAVGAARPCRSAGVVSHLTEPRRTASRLPEGGPRGSDLLLGDRRPCLGTDRRASTGRRLRARRRPEGMVHLDRVVPCMITAGRVVTRGVSYMPR